MYTVTDKSMGSSAAIHVSSWHSRPPRAERRTKDATPRAQELGTWHHLPSMMKGLRRISCRRAFQRVSAFSRGAYHLSSPVSLRRRLALVTRIMGAYVSGTVKTMRTRQTPEKM